PGNDNYMVDNIGDVIVENANEGSDTVYSSVSYTLSVNVEVLALQIAGTTGTGNSGDNVIYSSAGVNTLLGGTGNDAYVINNSADVIVENANEGTDTAWSSVSYTLGANLENLILFGSGGLNGTGNNLQNTITGNAENNVIDGGAGADTLMGGAGNDNYM